MLVYRAGSSAACPALAGAARRVGSAGAGDAQAEQYQGNLVEVEQAVIGSTEPVDLNGMAMADEDDEYTLLHLAVMNEHYDAVQRLLHGEGAGRSADERRGNSALHGASEGWCLPRSCFSSNTRM